MTLEDMRERMAKSFRVLIEQLVGVHSGGMSVGLVGTVRVPYFGQIAALSHAASITADKARIIVSPFDKSSLKAVEAALKNAGINAYVFSKNDIVVPIPAMDGEQIQRTVGRIKTLGEVAKVAIRNIRKQARGKDREHDREIQAATDHYIERIDTLIAEKTRQIAR